MVWKCSHKIIYEKCVVKKHYFIFICVFMRIKFKGYKTDISDYFWSVVDMSLLAETLLPLFKNAYRI